MTQHWKLVAACVVGVALAGCANGNMMDDDHDDLDDEQAVTMADLPKAVQETLTKEAGVGKIEDIDKQHRNGKTEYEADVLMDGKKWEISIREDGQLLKKELDDERDDEDESNDD